MRQIHIQNGVVAWIAQGVIAGWGFRIRGRPGRLPECRPIWLEQPRTRNDDVYDRKGVQGGGPHGRELRPRSHIGLVEESNGLFLVGRTWT